MNENYDIPSEDDIERDLLELVDEGVLTLHIDENGQFYFLTIDPVF